MSRLSDIMAATGMTREQIRRAVATHYGRFNPDTYGRYPSEADTRLANLYNVMRERGRYLTPPITTTEQAGELRRLIQANAPVESGALRDSFDDPRTVQIMQDGAVEIDNPLPYARIQDLGGTIHRVSPAGNSYTIRIPAQHYVGKAIAEYNAAHAEEHLRQSDTLGGLSIADLVTRGTALVQSLRRAG
jgi:hypothetical protein